jgi:hypothetical protein
MTTILHIIVKLPLISMNAIELVVKPMQLVMALMFYTYLMTLQIKNSYFKKQKKNLTTIHCIIVVMFQYLLESIDSHYCHYSIQKY